MTRHFVELLQIAIKHNYYANGLAKELSLVPSMSTAQLMRQFGLIGKYKSAAYLLAFTKEQDQLPAVIWMEQPQVLRFYLQCNDPYFYNITDIPFFNPAEQILHFDTLHPTKDLSLSKAAQVTQSDLLPLRPTRFTFKSPEAKILALKDARLHNLASTESDDPKTLPWQPKEGNDDGTFQINLSTFPPGKYGLETASEQIYWFYLEDPTRKPQQYGVIEVYLERDTLMALTKGEAQSPSFQVAFEARSTRWRYFVINRNELVFKDLKVSINEKEDFQVETKRPLRSGAEVAIPISSRKPLKLQERQLLKPKLHLIKANSNTELSTPATMIDLPTPNGQQLSPERQDEAAVGERVLYSDMYIYL